MATFENECLDQYRRGQVEALGKLIEHYRRPLFGFILKMTGTSLEAEEIFQEVWFRAIRKLDSYREKSFLSWLFRIAHNLVIDQSRKKKPAFSLQEHRDDEQPMEEKIAARGLSPDQIAGGHDMGRRIRAAVARLPVEQREVFLMRTEPELSFKEIAKIQGTSINTALARMQYALAKLKDELAGDYEALSRT
jgi:RNA polymerase sigma-70 factor (ECF subfamily)